MLSDFDRSGFRLESPLIVHELAFDVRIERIFPESLTIRRITTPELASLRFTLTIKLDWINKGDNVIPYPRIG